MTLNHFKILVAVYEEGSETAAAKKLYISQPSVSQAIHEIEDELGAPLFERLSRKLHITPLGRLTYNYALQILGLYDEIFQSSKNHQKPKEIRVGCGIAFGKLFMPKIIKTFQTLHPDCKISVTINVAPLLWSQMDKNLLDFCIVEGTTQINRNYVCEPLPPSPVVAFCNVSHPLAQKEHITLQDLSRCNLLLREKHSQLRSSVESCFANQNLSISPAWDSVSAFALINAVSENLGVSMLPLNYITAMKKPNIAILDVEGLNIERYLNVYYLKGKVLSSLMLSFIELCNDFVDRYNLPPESVTLD